MRGEGTCGQWYVCSLKWEVEWHRGSTTLQEICLAYQRGLAICPVDSCKWLFQDCRACPLHRSNLATLASAHARILLCTPYTS